MRDAGFDTNPSDAPLAQDAVNSKNRQADDALPENADMSVQVWTSHEEFRYRKRVGGDPFHAYMTVPERHRLSALQSRYDRYEATPYGRIINDCLAWAELFGRLFNVPSWKEGREAFQSWRVMREHTKQWRNKRLVDGKKL